MNLKNSDKLLADIADGLASHMRTKIGSIEVVFIADTGEYSFELAKALDAIANDLFWDERGNWQHADRAEVRSF